MEDQLEQRVAALERAVTDGEGDAAALAEAAVTADRLEDCEATVEDLEDRVAELEAATQALRGYVGNVRSVNREVEERADLALSRVEALTGRAEAVTGDRAGAQSEGGHGGEKRRCGGDHDVGPGVDRDQQPRSERCGRCGRPTWPGPGPDGSSHTESEAAGTGDGATGHATSAGGAPTAAVDAGGGGEREASARGAPTTPSWSEASAPGPAGEGVRASDSPDADGPIDRLRQLL